MHLASPYPSRPTPKLNPAICAGPQEPATTCSQARVETQGSEGDQDTDEDSQRSLDHRQVSGLGPGGWYRKGSVKDSSSPKGGRRWKAESPDACHASAIDQPRRGPENVHAGEAKPRCYALPPTAMRTSPWGATGPSSPASPSSSTESCRANLAAASSYCPGGGARRSCYKARERGIRRGSTAERVMHR